MARNHDLTAAMYAGPDAFPIERRPPTPGALPWPCSTALPTPATFAPSWESLRANVSKLTKQQRAALRKLLDSLDAMDDAGA